MFVYLIEIEELLCVFDRLVGIFVKFFIINFLKCFFMMNSVMVFFVFILVYKY